MQAKRVLLSKKEKKFLEDLLKGNVEKYSYHYKKVLKRRILDKRKKDIEDIALITRAEELLKNV